MKNLAAAIRPSVTLLLVIVFCGLVILGRPVPESFNALVISVVSFWFGSRQSNK